MSGQVDSRCRAADNCDEEQVVQKMSVSVKKSCFDELGIYNLDEHLKKIQMKQLERKHVVLHIEKSDNSHHLEGCFCGIKAVREELQQIVAEKMKEKQKQDEIRNEEKRLEDERMTLAETNEIKRQNVSDKILKTTTHFLPMDRDLYDYLKDNCHEELKALCSLIKDCETELGFAIEIKLNTEENIEKIKNDISALQNRFIVREHKVPEAVNFSKLKDAVTGMATQKKNNVTPIFDSVQKTIKIIGSPKEADEIIKWILRLSASQHSDVKDENVTKNNIETVNEKTHMHSDQKSLTIEETKTDKKKTLINDTESDCPDGRGTTKDDSMGDDSKTLPNDTSPHHLDKQGTTKNDTKDERKTVIGDTHSEHQHEDIKAKAETRGYAEKTLNDNTKSKVSDSKCPTMEDEKKTPTDCSKSYPDNNEKSKHEVMGHDKKKSTDNNSSEHQGKEVTTKTDDKNALIDSTKLENPDEKDTTTDNTKENTKKIIDETTSEHADKKGASKPTIEGINGENTKLEHDSVGVSGKESNVKHICEKGEANDRNKEIIADKEVSQFSKTEDKSEYDNECQRNQSPGAATADNYPLRQPTKQRKLTRHISMDEEVYKYIQRYLHMELEDVKAFCNTVQEQRDEGSSVKLCYTLKYEFDDETVRRKFQMLIDQVKVEEYNVPSMINASVLESVVCASTKSEATMIFVQSKKNSLKIIGRPDRVDKVKKCIDETVSEQLQSQEQLSTENTHASGPGQPYKQYPEKKYNHQIKIDENLYTYISAHCHQDIDKASKRCTSIGSSQNESTFTIDFALHDMRDKGFVTRVFEKLKGQFKVEECRVTNGIEFDGLASVVMGTNSSKEVMIFPHVQRKILKLIGPNTEVSQTKKWIESLISDSLKSEQLPKQKTHHSSPIKDQPQGSRQTKPVVSTSLQSVNPVNPPRKPGERFKMTSITSDSIVYESKRVMNRLTVRVHHANIIKQNTDVLVSCEDEWLQSGSVLAMALKEAAGPDVSRELANISKTRGPLKAGQVVHTSSGKLWPSVKYLAHVIRPERSQYPSEDPKTFEILYQTFLNCFKYTNSKICRSSISIPPIGARKYGVQMVSAAFFQAVMEYDAIAESTRSSISLHSIHFVDQDPAVVKQMITPIKSLLE